jgi:hypothetical protein
MPGGAMLGALPPEVMEKIKAMLGGLQPGGQPMGMMKRPMQTSMPADPGAGAPNVTNAAPNVTSVAKNVMPPPSPAQNPWLEQLLKSLQRPPVPAQPPAGPMPGYPYQPNPIGQWGARRDI